MFLVNFFEINLIISFVVLLGFAIWILIDASFHIMLDVALIDLRLRPHPGIDMHSAHKWIALGPRLAVFGGLSILGVFSTILTFVRLMVGNSNRSNIAAWLMFVLLIGAWLFLFTRLDGLYRFGFEWRIRRQLVDLRSLASQFGTSWPTDDVEISPYGLFRFDKSSPWIISAPPAESEYPFHEAVGPFVRRSDKGAILLDLASGNEVRLEFHPPNGTPKSFNDRFDDLVINHQLLKARQLTDDAYLCWYSADRSTGL